MLAQIAQGQAVREVVLDELAGGGGEQHLAAVAGVAEAGGAVDVEADVVAADEGRVAGVERHPHAERHAPSTPSFPRFLGTRAGWASWPGMGAEGALRRDRRRQGIGGASEDGEDTVAS